jgi:hypothetical protein
LATLKSIFHILEMSASNVALNIGTNVHFGIASRPSTLVDDSNMFSLKEREKKEKYYFQATTLNIFCVVQPLGRGGSRISFSATFFQLLWPELTSCVHNFLHSIVFVYFATAKDG